MALSPFDNGYWYATELKTFAKTIAILSASKLRKDEIEGAKLTYGDLVAEYVRLNQTREPFAHIPHVRYINFVSDFLAAEKPATREQAIRAWKKLKTLDVPKTYRAWARAQSRPK
ncbi:MAG: hypothetical protein ABI818_04475 [Acidobacteriota bacterium]